MVEPDVPDAEEAPLWQRLGWMVLIWSLSISVLGVVAYILRLWIA